VIEAKGVIVYEDLIWGWWHKEGVFNGLSDFEGKMSSSPLLSL